MERAARSCVSPLRFLKKWKSKRFSPYEEQNWCLINSRKRMRMWIMLSRENIFSTMSPTFENSLFILFSSYHKKRSSFETVIILTILFAFLQIYYANNPGFWKMSSSSWPVLFDSLRSIVETLEKTNTADVSVARAIKQCSETSRSVLCPFFFVSILYPSFHLFFPPLICTFQMSDNLSRHLLNLE